MKTIHFIQQRVGFTDGKPSWQKLTILGGIRDKDQGREVLQRLRASGGTYRLTSRKKG